MLDPSIPFVDLLMISVHVAPQYGHDILEDSGTGDYSIPNIPQRLPFNFFVFVFLFLFSLNLACEAWYFSKNPNSWYCSVVLLFQTICVKKKDGNTRRS
jgi:hypothetical protein